MTDSKTYEYVERWNLTDDTHKGRYFAVNEKGEPRPQTREEFVAFMEHFGFRLELTVDKTGAHWTDNIVRAWAYSHDGTVSEINQSADGAVLGSATYKKDAQDGVTK